MPTLKQLTCNIEWAATGTPLSEYCTSYLDGYVQTYVEVPEIPVSFAIHLTSDGYIAPGLAMFVYIDGEYQCNRNRNNLKKFSKKTNKPREIDFRVRQKEIILANGSFIGKQWSFQTVKIGKSCPPPFL